MFEKRTVNIDLVTLKATSNLLVKWGFLSSNVFNYVKKFKLEENPKEWFTDNEIKLILNNIQEIWFRNFVLVAIYT